MAKPDNLVAVTEYNIPTHGGGRTPWPGDPRVNIQNDKGMAKTYQVKQVLKAIECLAGPGNVVEVQEDVKK